MAETWYVVSWKEITFDTEGKMHKRYHQVGYWTRAGAEKMRANLQIRFEERTVDNIRLEAVHFDKPPPGMPPKTEMNK